MKETLKILNKIHVSLGIESNSSSGAAGEVRMCRKIDLGTLRNSTSGDAPIISRCMLNAYVIGLFSIIYFPFDMIES